MRFRSSVTTVRSPVHSFITGSCPSQSCVALEAVLGIISAMSSAFTASGCFSSPFMPFMKRAE